MSADSVDWKEVAVIFAFRLWEIPALMESMGHTTAGAFLDYWDAPPDHVDPSWTEEERVALGLARDFAAFFADRQDPAGQSALLNLSHMMRMLSIDPRPAPNRG
ncbi:hypothetical protein SEA_FIREMAN_94 [Microbacterium phage Fireman]|uniref:Uncharacterized protein n=2 Tax=Metamorphoovirus TaxID=2733195 RepID=A0A481VW60_9CAUD|nr:hypothetical protein HOT43_gp99 [Microbacterium phage RobsFeet]YP_009820331.1 hypothetical protein HOV22_gp96 [Microbacterium phage Fireman]AWY06103.1 hypothetical protein SEA_ROBSFEET_97 [Microbacterium phage RobsFeet]QBI98176.1 hypothetical protein SEA_FIREMAN_94 [Microbacterium phage Fireman]